MTSERREYRGGIDSDKISWTVRALESIENNSIDRDEVESEAIDCEENPQFRVRFQVGGVWFTAQKSSCNWITILAGENRATRLVAQHIPRATIKRG